eukprot:4711972-Prymnesium_polylepis.1
MRRNRVNNAMQAQDGDDGGGGGAASKGRDHQFGPLMPAPPRTPLRFLVLVSSVSDTACVSWRTCRSPGW